MSLESDFRRHLTSELKSLNVPVVSEYRVPGSDYVIDLFVPSLPRAAIEIRTKHSHGELSEKRRLTELFAGRLLTFWIYLEEDVSQSIQLSRGEDAFILCVSVEHPESISGLAVTSAKNIFEVLTRICQERFGHELAGASAWQVEEAADRYSRRSRDSRESRLGAYEIFYALGGEELPTSKTTRALLYALRCLLPPERYVVFQHELKQLETEFREGHFTACALRVGRSLEIIMYGAARAWGVRLDDPMFSLIEDLQMRLQLLNSAIIDYRSADNQVRTEKKAALQKLGAEFAGRLNSIGFLLDDESLQVNSSPPRNIEAILRDIRKTHGRVQVVRDEIKAVIDSGLIRAILDVRNDAAHSNLDGDAREVSEETVMKMLENVQLLVHKLSIIGEVIVAGER